MNKTLLLILLDFLLLHMIHDSPWDRVEKENAHLSGGTDTYAQHAEELQFVRLQMQAEAEQVRALGHQLAFSKQSEAQRAADFATAKAKGEELERQLTDKTAELSETERQRIIALRDAAERNEIIKVTKDDLDKINKDRATLTNTVERLSANIGDLKNQIGDLKTDFTTKITNLNNTNAKLAMANGRLSKENETLDGNLKTANTQVNTLGANLKRTSSNLIITQQQLQAATGAVNDLKTEKTTLTKERDNALTGRAQAETQVKDLVVKVGEEQQRTKNANALAQRQVGEEQQRTKNANALAQRQQTRAVSAEKDAVVAKTQAVAATQERDNVIKINQRMTKDIGQFAKNADVTTQRTLNEVIKTAKAIPQSPNKLYNEYLANRVPLQMQLSRSKPGVVFINGKPRAAPRQITKISQPVLVQGEKYLYALMHTDQSPFALKPQGGTWEKAAGIFRRNGKKIPVHWIGFLRSDPRIVAVPLHNDSKKKEFLDVKKTYSLAKRPQDFPEAIIIHNGEAYGVVEFRIDPALGNYVRMDKPFLGGLFSKKFNPVRGDLVVSRTGMLLGIMVNNKYCLVIRENELDKLDESYAAHVVFSDKTHINGLSGTLRRLADIIKAKPGTLR
jgi:hypothetical protein